MKNIIHNFIHEKSEKMMLFRTVFETGLSWVVVNTVKIVALTNLDPAVQTLMVSFFTVIFTAVINWYRKATAEDV